MFVLVVDGNRADRELAARHISGAGHEVQHAPDAKAALTVLAHRAPDAALIESGALRCDGLDLIKRLRASQTGARACVVVTSALPGSAELVSAFAAGADDFLRKPLCRDELLLRLGSVERARKWAVVGAPGAAIAHDWTSQVRVETLRAWSDIDARVAADLGGLIGRALHATGLERPLSRVVYAAEMPLTAAAEQTEVRVVLGIDPGTVGTLAAEVLGDRHAPEAAMRDVVREFANMAGGAFKRAAEGDGLTFTCGLPTDVDPTRVAQTSVVARRHFLLASDDDAVRIGVIIEVRSRVAQKFTLGQLREGMVLVHDVRNHAGAVLIASGTRLTASSIERMTRFLPSRMLLEIANAA